MSSAVLTCHLTSLERFQLLSWSVRVLQVPLRETWEQARVLAAGWAACQAGHLPWFVGQLRRLADLCLVPLHGETQALSLSVLSLPLQTFCLACVAAEAVCGACSGESAVPVAGPALPLAQQTQTQKASAPAGAPLLSWSFWCCSSWESSKVEESLWHPQGIHPWRVRAREPPKWGCRKAQQGVGTRLRCVGHCCYGQLGSNFGNATPDPHSSGN